jgi:hypothetical protein
MTLSGKCYYHVQVEQQTIQNRQRVMKCQLFMFIWKSAYLDCARLGGFKIRRFQELMIIFMKIWLELISFIHKNEDYTKIVFFNNYFIISRQQNNDSQDLDVLFYYDVHWVFRRGFNYYHKHGISRKFNILYSRCKQEKDFEEVAMWIVHHMFRVRIILNEIVQSDQLEDISINIFRIEATKQIASHKEKK